MKQKTAKQRRKTRVRQKIKQSGRGRKLTVFRSNQYLWGQIVDLPSGKTLVSANGKKLIKKYPKFADKPKTDRAFELGKQIAEQALKKKIFKVVFDRGPYSYHGRVKAFAKGARAGGLEL